LRWFGLLPLDINADPESQELEGQYPDEVRQHGCGRFAPVLASRICQSTPPFGRCPERKIADLMMEATFAPGQRPGRAAREKRNLTAAVPVGLISALALTAGKADDGNGGSGISVRPAMAFGLVQYNLLLRRRRRTAPR
jgi:hypothetical protein